MTVTVIFTQSLLDHIGQKFHFQGVKFLATQILLEKQILKPLWMMKVRKKLPKYNYPKLKAYLVICILLLNHGLASYFEYSQKEHTYFATSILR